MPSSRSIRLPNVLRVAAALVVLAACSPSTPDLAELAPTAVTGGRLWPTAGHDLSNTRNAKTERWIGPDTVADLAMRWATATEGDVTATPAVDGSSVYVPDWAGNLYRLDRRTGEVLWSRTIESFTGVAGDVSSTTPAVHDGLLILGSQGGTSGAHVAAVDIDTGAPVWTTIVDPHLSAIVTQSPVVFDGKVFVGVASVEEVLAAVIPGYACCSFRGRMVALDAATGQVIWSTTMAPEGYAGNAIFGSTPVVDPKRRSVYVTTGPNTSVPQDVLDCVAAAGGDPGATQACVTADDLFDAIVALDLDTGAIRWATRTEPYDAWTFACLDALTATNCPVPAGPGLGFDQGAMLFRTSVGGGQPSELLGAGAKSGAFWVLDPDTGQVVWTTLTGPGSVLGGLQGASVDGDRIYVANANAEAVTWTLPDGSTTTRGFWSALHAATGELLWQTADPAPGPSVPPGSVPGPVTVANGVVFGCSADDDGRMYALDAASGAPRWSFDSGGPCAAGAAVVDGTVFWGSGSGSLGGLPGATGSHVLYAFGLSD